MQTISFNYPQMSATVRETLQKAFGPNAAVRTDEGEAGHICVRIVSDRFDGLSERVKQGLVWDTLWQELKEEAKAVALIQGGIGRRPASTSRRRRRGMHGPSGSARPTRCPVT